MLRSRIHTILYLTETESLKHELKNQALNTNPILTMIGKSRKQNPKTGNFTDRVSWKQNPVKIKKIHFGNFTERVLWKQNPVFFFDFWELHRACFAETKSISFHKLDFVSAKHAR